MSFAATLYCEWLVIQDVSFYGLLFYFTCAAASKSRVKASFRFQRTLMINLRIQDIYGGDHLNTLLYSVRHRYIQSRFICRERGDQTLFLSSRTWLSISSYPNPQQLKKKKKFSLLEWPRHWGGSDRFILYISVVMETKLTVCKDHSVHLFLYYIWLKSFSEISSYKM